MSSSLEHLESARARWQALPALTRTELARALVDRDEEAGARDRLCAILVGTVTEGMAPAMVGGRERDRLREVLQRVSAPLFAFQSNGTESPYAAAYAQQLLALTLPLTSGEAAGSAEDLRGLLLRSHSHEVVAPVARERALQRLAGDLIDLAGEELRARAKELAGPFSAARTTRSWIERPEVLPLSVDHVTLSCARYLAGLQAPERDRYGYDELRAGRGGRAKRVDQVTVRFEPASPASLAGARSGTPVAGGLPASELKAKLFVALFALTAIARSRGESGAQRVRLRDLLAMMGFELGSSTNSTYYWRYAAQLTRYLLVDLPARVVAMQIQLAGEREPRVLFEPLLGRAVPLGGMGERLPPAAASSLAEIIRGEEIRGGAPNLGTKIRELGLVGFEFAVSDDLLEAHGIGKPMNAIEHVPVEVLSLKGPAFWLAWQVAFLRRWAVPPKGGAGGKSLLRVLEESGHLAACATGGRVRYRDALSTWWRDAGELAALGLLDEPGVRLYAKRGSSWREISSELSRSLDPEGSRLTRKRLEEVRVVFQIPQARFASLQRARRRRIGGSASVGPRRSGDD